MSSTEVKVQLKNRTTDERITNNPTTLPAVPRQGEFVHYQGESYKVQEVIYKTTGVLLVVTQSGTYDK